MQPRSIRLNQDLRDDFINTVVHEIMPPEKEPTIRRFQETYAQAAYDATYGPILDIINQLPAWAKQESKCFFVLFNGAGAGLAFVLPQSVTTLHKEPYDEYSNYHMSPNNGSPIPTLSDDHPIVEAYKNQKQALLDWKEKRNALHMQLRELTNSCNTTGQLFKTWPKAMEFAHIFPQPEPTTRTEWKPSMDAAELDLGVELSQVDVAPIEEN